jgi:putative transcriptional regulator
VGNADVDDVLGHWDGGGHVEIPMKNRVRDLRAALHWTQADLAGKLEVSRQTVNAIETEKYDPSLPLAIKIARLFQKPVEEIFEA